MAEDDKIYHTVPCNKCLKKEKLANDSMNAYLLDKNSSDTEIPCFGIISILNISMFPVLVLVYWKYCVHLFWKFRLPYFIVEFLLRHSKLISISVKWQKSYNITSC